MTRLSLPVMKSFKKHHKVLSPLSLSHPLSPFSEPDIPTLTTCTVLHSPSPFGLHQKWYPFWHLLELAYFGKIASVLCQPIRQTRDRTNIFVFLKRITRSMSSLSLFEAQALAILTNPLSPRPSKVDLFAPCPLQRNTQPSQENHVWLHR